MSDIKSNNSESTQLMSGPRGGLSLAIASLILPVLSGVLLIFVTAFPVALGINVATVFATAVLVAIDASRLGKVDLKGRRREHAGLLFVGLCALWIVVYPIAFFSPQCVQFAKAWICSSFCRGVFCSRPNC